MLWDFLLCLDILTVFIIGACYTIKYSVNNFETKYMQYSVVFTVFMILGIIAYFTMDALDVLYILFG